MHEEMIEKAKIVMADTFKFYLKAQNYHWNVQGIHFLQFHDLFGKIYEEVFGSIDTIAEEIRAMGTQVPGSFGRFNELSRIEDEREELDVTTMLRRLYHDNLTVLDNLKVAYDASEAAGNHGFSNLMAERMSAHRKHGWMLRASLA